MIDFEINDVYLTHVGSWNIIRIHYQEDLQKYIRVYQKFDKYLGQIPRK